MKRSKVIVESHKRMLVGRFQKQKETAASLELLVYWSSLAMLALFNLVGVFFMIPFIMFFDGVTLFACVAGFGFVFGFLFNLLIMGIEHFKLRHHLIAGLFIPVLAVVDIVLIVRIVERINMMLAIPLNINIPVIVMAFIFSFVLPYLFSVVTGRHKM